MILFRLAVRTFSTEVCGRQGTSGIHPRVFHHLICTLMVKRILLLALRSLRTAVCDVVKGLHAAAGRRVSLGFDRVGSVSPGLWVDR